MTFNKNKNGYKITVKNYSNTVTITKNNQLIKALDFSDHIKAFIAAKNI